MPAHRAFAKIRLIRPMDLGRDASLLGALLAPAPSAGNDEAAAAEGGAR